MVQLTDPAGNTVDQIDFERQRLNVSFGRLSDGSLAYLPNPTIGAANDDTDAFLSLVSLPKVSERSGIYQDPVTVTLSADPGIEIRYTLDGTNPTISSPLYTSPITVNPPTPLAFPEAVMKGVALKAVSFENGQESLIASRTFLFNVDHDLPVVILTADLVIDEGLQPVEFFTRDELYGSFFINGRVRFDFLETDGSHPISQYVEFRETGRNSASIPPLNGKMFARARYGKSELSHRFFPDKVRRTKFSRILLRNTSQDFANARLRDGIFSRFLSTDQIADVDYEGYRPCVAYLNGEYIGHLNLREDDDREFVEEYFDLTPPVTPRTASGGGNLFFSSFRDFQNPTASDAIERVDQLRRVNESLLDDALRDSMEAHRFDRFVTTWTSADPSEPRRISLHDYDSSFKFFAQIFEDDFDPPVTWSRILWQGGLEMGGDDIRFWEEVVQYTAAYCNLFADSDRMEGIIDAAAAEIRSEMPDTIEFFRRRRAKVNRPEPFDFNAHADLVAESMTEWEESVSFIRAFPRLRLEGALDAIRATHSLPNFVNVTLNSSDDSMGVVRAHGLRVTTGREAGSYFSTFPLRLTAEAKPGFVFQGWQGSSTSTEANISPILTADSTFTAVFAPATIPVATAGRLAISEIHYNPLGTSENDEFIELLNLTDTPLDLSGVSFIEGIAYTFPVGTSLPANERIVIRPSDYQGRLDNDGETLSYLDTNDEVIETLRYNDGNPWPEAADGQGHSLIRIQPNEAENISEPTAWRLSVTPGGNPGTDDQLSLSDQTSEGLLEYAFGSQGPQLTGSADDSGVTLSFERIVNADDVIITLFQSPNLLPTSWQSVSADALLSETLPVGGRETITVGPMPSSAQQMFFRLEVTVR